MSIRCPNCHEVDFHRRGYICQSWTEAETLNRIALHQKYHWPLPPQPSEADVRRDLDAAQETLRQAVQASLDLSCRLTAWQEEQKSHE